MTKNFWTKNYEFLPYCGKLGKDAQRIAVFSFFFGEKINGQTRYMHRTSKIRNRANLSWTFHLKNQVVRPKK